MIPASYTVISNPSEMTGNLYKAAVAWSDVHTYAAGELVVFYVQPDAAAGYLNICTDGTGNTKHTTYMVTSYMRPTYVIPIIGEVGSKIRMAATLNCCSITVVVYSAPVLTASLSSGGGGAGGIGSTITLT
jgi:hypothetical protein